MQIDRFMREQPLAIVNSFAAARDALAQMRLSDVERVLLVGSGSSLNASTVAAPLLADAFGSCVDVVGPSRYLTLPVTRQRQSTLVVVTSQTGASTTSVEALRQAVVQGGPTLLVTAVEDGPAALLGTPVLLIPIRDEPIGPKTKGYVGSCAALFALAAVRKSGIPSPDNFRPALEAALEEARLDAARLVDQVSGLDYILVTGTGSDFGTALEASLKIAEIAGVPTAAFTLEETLHGRLHGLTQRSLCVVVVSDEATRHLARIVEAALAPLEVRVVVVEAGSGPHLPSPWSTLASTFFFQHLAVGLGRRNGCDPDLMRYPGLTTKLVIKTGTSR